MLFLPGRLLLGDGGASWSLTSASVCMGSLSADRQGPAMAQSPVASDIHQALDVHLDSLAQVAFYLTLRLENRPDATEFVLVEIADASAMVNTRFGQNRTRARTTDTVDIC